MLGAAAAQAQDPWDLLDPLTRRIYLSARADEDARRFDEALRGYAVVADREPTFRVRAILDRGRVLEAMDLPAEAEVEYLRAEFDADVVEALARLYLRTDRPDRAAPMYRRLRGLRSEAIEFLVLEATATAAFDPAKADALLRDYLGRQGARVDLPEVLDATRATVAGLRDAGRTDAGAALLALVMDRLEEEGAPGDDPSGVLAALGALADRFQVEEQAAALAAAADRPLDPAQRRGLQQARERFARGEVEAAEADLREVIAANPENAETWAALADVLTARGEIALAEEAIVRAELLAPWVAAYPARLGDLLADHYGGRFDREAADAYGRALQRQGAWPELWCDRARLLQRSGSPDRAAAAYRTYLRLAPGGGCADTARGAVAGWERIRPAPPTVPRAAGRPAAVSAEGWEALHRALVYQARASDPARDHDAEIGHALEELAVVLERDPEWPRALNLAAGIHLELGDRAEALALYRRSQAVDPDQGPVLLALFQLLREDEPAEAEAMLTRAAELGAPEALVELAGRAWDRWDGWTARSLLDAYFANATSGSTHARATRLAREIDGSVRLLGVVGGVSAAALVGLPLLALGWRRAGVGVPELLRRAPAAYREVARIGSAIRHEVLKHHTTVLASVAEALEERDPEPARWAAARLYGPEGAIARFRAYVGELEVLGRVHGVRLNLRHRDAVFGPLVQAMDRLASLEPELRAGSGRRLAAELDAISAILNHTGYRGLGHLIQRVCVLELDRSILADGWERVTREPAFRGAAPVAFEVALPDERIFLRIWRRDLEDILVNLLRNSLEATLAEGARAVGVKVDTEEDEVTGLERVAIRVVDDAPRRISTAMIRGRYIGRGLGLAVDLISRAGGSVHVEDEPGRSKAVVVRLPRAELAADQDED